MLSQQREMERVRLMGAHGHAPPQSAAELLG